MAEAVPTVDFAAYGLRIADSATVSDSCLGKIAEEFRDALSTVGFCYLKNHGIPQKKIDEVFQVSKTFFTQPEDVKEKCRSPNNNFNGFQALEKERLTPSRPGDLKETFNYTLCSELLNIEWPDDKVPGMQRAFSVFFQLYSELAFRVLDIMSLALSLERNYLRQKHTSLGGQNSPTTLRSVFYPPLPQDGSIKPNQMRCGEHTDYGTVALLLQDDIGGLEILNNNDEFVAVPPKEGTVVINIGDLMQRWTSDRLKATVHRVMIPPDELKKNKCRQSMVLFVDPDGDVIIECLDGSGKYEPISSHDFVSTRIRDTYVN